MTLLSNERPSRKPNDLADFLEISKELQAILQRALAKQRRNTKGLARLHPNYRHSGANFLHYLALRRIDLRSLQLRLAQLGLSSLGRAESCVISSVQQTLDRVSDSLQARGSPHESVESKWKKGQVLTLSDAERLLHKHTRELFGPKPESRHVYIMVTAPSFPEFSSGWVRKVLRSGANLIRINCAHDSEPAWRRMAQCIRKESSELGVSCLLFMDLAGPKIRTATASYRKLSLGSQFWLVKKLEHRKREVQCAVPEVLRFVAPANRVFFDDGKIETKVVGKRAGRLLLEVTRVPAPKTKLKAEKGINFPDSHLRISAVTDQDLLDLEVVSELADLVGMSFVQSPLAVRRIRKALEKLTDCPPAIVLKIETKAGFQALPSLLMEAMRGYPCGVMIARGDLAVETGFERMVEVQEEILWLCESAHVPVIWATQVLESQAKAGLPSRAEVTDAASAVRAECVMLNKGKHICSAIRTLDNILRRMEGHVYKKRTLDRKLMVAEASLRHSVKVQANPRVAWRPSVPPHPHQ